MATPILEKAPADVHQMVNGILEAHHKELLLPDGSWPTVRVMAASAPKDSNEPALKDGLYRVLGKVKVVPYDQRADDRRDVVITIDADHWDSITEPQQRALLDHFLTCLEKKLDKDGVVKTDDCDRPILSIRPCDWFLKGFRSIAQRYGADAPEVVAAREFQERYGDVALKQEQALFASA